MTGMDFGFDETQEDLRALARSILDVATPERIAEIERTDEGIDRDLWKEFAHADLLGVALPEDVGGSGHGIMELCVLLEEVGRRVAPIPLRSTIGLGSLPIARFGTAGQRKKYLVPVVDGSSLLTAALDEPARHDPLQPATTARKDGSVWRLDGLKVAVPHAPLVDRIVVSARIDPPSESIDAPEGRGWTPTALFLVDPASAGVSVQPTRSTHREVQGNVTLEGAVVDDDDVIADPAALPYLYEHALACMCATAVGVVDEAVRITASYISEREQFGKPIATFQGATLKAADAYIDAEAIRATVWSAIWRLSQGRPCADELAIAKYWVAYGGQNAVHHCQHLHGGMGVSTDYPIHRYFIWAKELEIALGGEKAQLLRLGASMAEGA